jgi:cell division topological specificity factor
MSLLDMFRRQPNSAQQARERLQILLAHERAGQDSPDYLPKLQQELLEVVKKYVAVDDDKVQVQLDQDADVSTLEVNVELPEAKAQPASGRERRRRA